MERLARLARIKLLSEANALRFAQLACFGAAPAMLGLCIEALRRQAATPGEFVVGLIAAVAVALLCVLIGLVIPMTRR